MKRAQIQLGETIFVVIFILIIIVLGLVFYAGGKSDATQRKQDTFEELDAIALSQTVLALKELTCSTYDVEESTCLDKIRLEAFSNLTTNNWDLVGEYYVEQLGNVIIEVEEIYPTPQKWVLYNYTFNVTDINRYNGSYQARSTELPIKLHDPIYNKYAFGILLITKYDR